jgi:hypothetical protein
MTDTSKDAGIIQALVERFEKHRLPIVLELKEKVDSGEVLSDREIDYLEQILEDARENKALVDRHPKWQKISAQVLGLYKEITEKALENEKNT